MADQKKAFLAYEADAWFERNFGYISGYDPAKDRVIALLAKYGLGKGSILEIGCSAGHRLNGIRKTFPSTRVFGIEPSQKAVEYGASAFPDITLSNGTADNLSSIEDNSMDVVIMGFVFYVVDRNVLFRVISEMDRVLKNGGALVIIDFFAESAIKNEYPHIRESGAYAFKQNYYEIFTASKLYFLLDKCTLSHVNGEPDASDDYFNKYSITLLKKDTLAGYR
jgi:ubiquinone/menaquinone biosynthesis C-methylase UbiE